MWPLIKGIAEGEGGGLIVEVQMVLVVMEVVEQGCGGSDDGVGGVVVM